MKLEIKKIKRSWYIMAGVSQLGRFRTEADAQKSLAEKPEFWAYWAGSIGVSYENREKKIVHV